MTDVTQQLADALRELLVAVHYADPPKNYGTEDEPNICHEARIPVGFVVPAHRALTAFEASRAAPAEDVVERVARAIGARHEAGYVVGSLYSENMRELARAALAAMPRDEGLEALRELLDEHDKAHGETKYTPAKQPPYSMTMDGLHRQTFAAMYAYVRNKLAATERGEG